MTIHSRLSLRTVTAAGLLAVVCLCAAGCGTKRGTVSNPAQKHHNVVYGRSNKGVALTEDIYSPEDRAKPAPLVIVIHGGGFTTGDKRDTGPFASTLASLGFVTATVNYSLASPGYPEQVKEIQRAIRWNIAHAGQFGADPHRVGIVGFSAGGYLGAMASLLDSEHQRGPTNAVVTLSAPLDLTAFARLVHARLVCKHRSACPKAHLPPLGAFASVYRFLGCATPKCSPQLITRASPTSHVNARAPAFLMFNAAHEVVPRSQPIDMANALRASRVPEQVEFVPGTVREAGYIEQASPTIVKFLRQRLGNSPLRLAIGKNPPPPGDPTLLLVFCALIAGASLALVVAAVRSKLAVAIRPKEAR